MRRPAALAFLTWLLLAPLGCITWRGGVDREYPGYLEFLEAAKGKSVAVTAFGHDSGLTRNRWARRKLFMAVSGSFFGVIPWPWDLKLVWSPPAIDLEEDFELTKYDDALARKIAKYALEETGFKSKVLDPREGGAQGVVKAAALVEKAKALGCDALYVVWHNEFTSLKYRTEVRRHQNYLQHRTKTLTGFAYVPSVALFDAKDGRALLVRSNTAQRRNVYVRYFWAPFFTYGVLSPFDSKTGALERFIKDVSAEDPEEARDRAAYTLVVRDLTPKQVAYDDYEDQEQPEPAPGKGAGTKPEAPADKAGKAGPAGKTGQDGAKEKPGAAKKPGEGAAKTAGQKKTGAKSAGGTEKKGAEKPKPGDEGSGDGQEKKPPG